MNDLLTSLVDRVRSEGLSSRSRARSSCGPGRRPYAPPSVVRVQATRAAKELEEARKLKEAVRAGLESQARVAAAAAADRRAAVVDRKMAAIDRAHNEGVIELLRARVKAVGDWSDA